MTLGFVALLIGLFGVPIVLLYVGHRLRRKSQRARRVFWGMLFGHTIGALLANIYSMIPPEVWSPDDFVRGGFGFYGMLAGGILGGLIGLAVSRRDSSLLR